MKKFIFIAAALILIIVASVATWQIYVPIHEDNVSVQTYENLRRFVELPTSVPISPLDAPSLPNVTPTPSPIPDSAAQPSPQVDFASLRTVNPEIVAWLTIEGTNIDYPVAKHSDNDYYLHHLFNGDVVVEIEYADTNVSLHDRLVSYASSLGQCDGNNIQITGKR